METLVGYAFQTDLEINYWVLTNLSKARRHIFFCFLALNFVKWKLSLHQD